LSGPQDPSITALQPPPVTFLNYLSCIHSNCQVRFVPSERHPPPPVVTLEEIENAENLCPHKPGACNILKINPSTIWKVEPVVQMAEAETPIIVREGFQSLFQKL
jgi:hypothetical protein